MVEEPIYASKDAATGETVYYQKTSAGQFVQVDEDALNELSGNLVLIQTDLAETRDLVTNGNLTRIKSMTFHIMPDFQFEQVDAINLKLGAFEDAELLQEAYREVFYKGKAEQIERINHGYATGEQVSRDITQTYLDEDGNVAADVGAVGAEFDSGNSITESDLEEDSGTPRALSGHDKNPSPDPRGRSPVMSEGEGKGKEYYFSTYTPHELWEKLMTQGDPWSVEQAGSVWSTAKGGLESARDQLNTSMLATVDYWQGPASEEFQRRMRLVYEYSEVAEEEMMEASARTIPNIAAWLTEAQQAARDQDLNPDNEPTYEVWVDEVRDPKPSDADLIDKQEQYKAEYAEYQTQRHEALAAIVGNLGHKYARAANGYKPPESPPEGMPGNETFQPPTGGVFGTDGMTTAGSTPSAPPASDGSGTDGGSLDGQGHDDDLEPTDEGWDPGSYDDMDSGLTGGLTTGGVSAVSGGTIAAGGMGAGGGGAALVGSAGLFGPAMGATSTAGTSPGRGGATTGKAGSTAPGRSGGTSGRGTGTGARAGAGKAGVGNPRGGTRSGYADDDEEEEVTRETWLKEDEIDWRSGDRTPDEELDD